LIKGSFVRKTALCDKKIAEIDGYNSPGEIGFEMIKEKIEPFQKEAKTI